MKAKIIEKQLTQIIQTIYSLKGTGILYLKEPIVVRLSSFSSFEIHGLCVSPSSKLFLMNEIGSWDELEATDVNADKLLESISQKIKLINNQKSAA